LLIDFTADTLGFYTYAVHRLESSRRTFAL